MILVSVVSGLSEVNSTFLSGNGVKDLGDGVADGIAGHEDLSDGVADGIAGHEDLSMLWMRPAVYVSYAKLCRSIEEVERLAEWLEGELQSSGG